MDGGKVHNLPKIQQLLVAVQKPQAIAIVHVPGHQAAKTPEAVGNNLANEAVKLKDPQLKKPEDPSVRGVTATPINHRSQILL